MKKSKLFLGFVAVVLAVVGFISTKANKKFIGITSAYARVLGVTITGLPSAHFTNVFSASVKTVYLKTVGNGVVSTLFTSSALGAKKVYYH